MRNIIWSTRRTEGSKSSYNGELRHRQAELVAATLLIVFLFCLKTFSSPCRLNWSRWFLFEWNVDMVWFIFIWSKNKDWIISCFHFGLNHSLVAIDVCSYEIQERWEWHSLNGLLLLDRAEEKPNPTDDWSLKKHAFKICSYQTTGEKEENQSCFQNHLINQLLFRSISRLLSTSRRKNPMMVGGGGISRALCWWWLVVTGDGWYPDIKNHLSLPVK